MKLEIYQVDAFTDRVFGGNPAAVVPLKDWLDDELLLQIAEENNLSETAFFVQTGPTYHLRWFTPALEVKLCGHATLASAFVLFNLLGYRGEQIQFDTLSGPLFVKREDDRITMDFPAATLERQEANEALEKALGQAPKELYVSSGGQYLAVYDNAETVAGIKPDFRLLAGTGRNVIITASGRKNVDFVSRFFAPVSGIDEDPVTGSAHTALTPYWAKRLNRNELTAKQLSKRGGDLVCRLKGDRVEISGQAKHYLTGRISI